MSEASGKIIYKAICLQSLSAFLSTWQLFCQEALIGLFPEVYICTSIMSLSCHLGPYRR